MDKSAASRAVATGVAEAASPCLCASAYYAHDLVSTRGSWVRRRPSCPSSRAGPACKSPGAGNGPGTGPPSGFDTRAASAGPGQGGLDLCGAGWLPAPPPPPPHGPVCDSDG